MLFPLLATIPLVVGCASFKSAGTLPCDALRDASSKINDPSLSKSCTNAALAASLIAREICMKQQGVSIAEIGDPDVPDEVLTLMAEYRNLGIDCSKAASDNSLPCSFVGQ